jgi:hypothetical protein
MSDANIFYLRKWYEKRPPPGELRNCFADTRETLELLNAFLRIENPIIRSTIIRTAREAVFVEPLPQVVKSNPDTWIFEARQSLQKMVSSQRS